MAAAAAEEAVKFVLGKLTDALLEKAQELYEVSGQIELMQTELRLIQALLRDADSKSNRDERVREWLNLVREIANRIEDVIDTFQLVEIQENRPKSCCWFPKPSCLNCCSNCNKLKTVLRNPKKMNKLSGELNTITQQLKLIYQRKTDLGIMELGAGGEENVELPFRPTKPSDIDESEVVGLEAATCEIIKQLLDKNESRRTVLSIVGTGGIGKTTLAQNVYKSAELVEQFDCRTWLSISQKFNINDLLREILYSIEPEMRKQNPPVTDEDVLVKLKSSLGRMRYLIILDDVWTEDLWDRLKTNLPDPNNASRVIITSRIVNVAKRADRNIEPYMLGYLNDDNSLALLFRKAFQKHIEPEKYPRDLLGVAKKFMKKCDGLPLALVVLGGILTTEEPTYSAWSKLEENMDWSDDDGKKCSQVLAMSYEQLPSYLKPCFLYFASFPEDYKISAKHVARMWVAEGFIPKDGSGTIEDRAERFLQELVQRCLIQVTEKSWNGYCKYCSIHDLLRDLAIHKAKEDNFFTIFSKEYEDVNQLATRKPHRAALQFCTLTKDGVYSENTRSLLCFFSEISSTNDSGFRLLNYSGFRLLRVLTMEHVDTREFTGSDWLKGLMHLRYLGLRYCYIQPKIFKKISLNNLETVDLKYSHIFDDKEEATDWSSDVVIPNLRHLCGYLKAVQCFPLKWDDHTNLQTLKYVDNSALPKLGCCINLRTLGISYSRFVRHSEEWQTLKSVLTSTEQLVSLNILAGGYFLPFGGTRDIPCHEKIESLCLSGEWAKDMWLPSVEMFPINLTKLVLLYSELEEDPIPILENLQSLRIFRLLSYSYMGTKLICSTGGFPNLKKLELASLPNLSHLDVKEGAMPILSHLIIGDCDELRTLPELPNVQIERDYYRKTML
ncbi:putative disease resistance RPP13-like protein 3 isoform X2 [Carex rostrata]